MVKRVCFAVFLVPWMASEAAACGVCASAMADAGLPPIHWWAGLATAWFLATTAISALFRIRLPVFPPAVVAFAVPLVLFLASSSFGLLPFVLLIPVASLPFASAFLPARGVFTNRKLRSCVLGLGTLGYVSVLALGFWSHHIRTTRTRAEFIVQWSYTPPSREYLRELKEEEPESLDEYRYILEYGNDLLVSDVAERIAALGNPEVDISLLEARLEEFQGDSYRDSCVEDIQAAIEKLREQAAQPEGSPGEP